MAPHFHVVGRALPDRHARVRQIREVRHRRLPLVRRGDLLATFSAGAYGMAMSSNYNSRPRAAEVLVAGSEHRLIRRRETFEDLVRCEREVG